MAWRSVTTRTHDVLQCERASVIRLEDSKIGELPDALAAGARREATCSELEAARNTFLMRADTWRPQ